MMNDAFKVMFVLLNRGKSLEFLKPGLFDLHFSVIYDLPKNKLIQWIITLTGIKLKLMDRDCFS